MFYLLYRDVVILSIFFSKLYSYLLWLPTLHTHAKVSGEFYPRYSLYILVFWPLMRLLADITTSTLFNICQRYIKYSSLLTTISVTNVLRNACTHALSTCLLCIFPDTCENSPPLDSVYNYISSLFTPVLSLSHA